MKESARQSVPTWLLATSIGIALTLTGAVAALAVEQHQRDEALATEHSTTQREWEAEQQAVEEAVAAREAEERALAEQAAMEAATQEAEERAAAREARRVAAEKAAAREAREQAAAEKAAAREAREQAAAEKAAAREAREQAAAEEAASARRVITGDFTVPDINGALVTQVGGYPGQPLSTLDMARLNKLESLLRSLESGRTYPCPQGSGGGFNDIAVGTQVVVQGGGGEVLATTTLTGGRVNMRGCMFNFQVQVPDADFYQVLVSHRGALAYSREDLQRSGWHVSGRL